MASQSTPTTPPSEVSLSPKQKKYLSTGDPLKEEEKNFLEKGTLTSEEKEFLDKKISIEKKLMSGEYGSLNEMATNIDGGTPSKEIETVIFKNMMKIMLREFNCLILMTIC